MDYLSQIKEAAQFIRERSNYQPTIGLVLGSGLGTLADRIESPEKFPYDVIPHFPVSTVKGHQGQLVIGKLNGKTVLAMQGRIHLYEGYSMQQLTFPIRVMKNLGIDTLFVTNACGGLNPDFEAGGLMFITDHINLMGNNPLIGENYDELGPRFPDMSTAYSKELIKLGREAANDLDLKTFTGVYSAISGPNYLSKAELRMVRKFGADTIGMSTIPEVIVAVHGGMRVLGISCITDMAIPDNLEPLTHAHVVEIANKVRPIFIQLVSSIIEKL